MAIDNNIEIAGNLVADPELRHTKSGAAILNARMAVNRRWNKMANGKKRLHSLMSLLGLNLLRTAKKASLKVCE